MVLQVALQRPSAASPLLVLARSPLDIFSSCRLVISSVLGIGNLLSEGLNDLLELKDRVKKMVERSYGPVVLFEHGSVTE